jgi:hypothetical protein
MANDSITEQPQSAEPDAGIRQLDWLVGTWKVSGGVTGQITFEWLEGGFFSPSASTSTTADTESGGWPASSHAKAAAILLQLPQ